MLNTGLTGFHPGTEDGHAIAWAGEFHYFGKKATFKSLRFLSKLDCMAGTVSFFRAKGEITRTRAHERKKERRDFSPFRAFPSRAL